MVAIGKPRKVECIFFRHSERLWHFTGQDGTNEITTADNFVLFLPKYSRVVSFESSEKGVQHEQFGWGSLGNVQLQATFGKLQAVAYRHMTSLGKHARFDDLRFIFRTIRDARTVHKGMRLDNFSFASTGDADADAFKVANYFIIVGKIASLQPYMDGSYPDYEVPANVKQITIVDSTDKLVCRINFTEARKGNESMDRAIEEFFSTGEVGDRFDKASHVVAIARWNIGDGEPEILYMKNIGEIQPDDEEKNNRMRRFYLLAYMNTRKNVDLESLRCSFPDLTEDELNDEYILVRGENAYFLQYEWKKDATEWNLEQGELKGSFDWVNDSWTIGPFFKLNPDASKLYLSAKPEGAFSNIYDASEATWPLVVKKGGYVAIGDKPVNVYVHKVREFLDNLEDKCYTTRILARGAKIPKAYDVANIVCKDTKYKLVDTIVSSVTIVENGQPKEISSITLVIAKSKLDVNANQIP
jgi:DNA-binding protein